MLTFVAGLFVGYCIGQLTEKREFVVALRDKIAKFFRPTE